MKSSIIVIKGSSDEAVHISGTKPASDQDDEPRNIKEDMRMVKEVRQPPNILEKCKLRIDSCNNTDNR